MTYYPKDPTLNAKDVETLLTLAAHLAAGRPPTVRQLAADLGLASTATPRYRLSRLVALGLVVRDGRHWRGIALTPRGQALVADDEQAVREACLKALLAPAAETQADTSNGGAANACIPPAESEAAPANAQLPMAQAQDEEE